MSEQPDQRPFSETDLESPEYRDRLMRKLNCLIALLEVALARVRRSLAGPEADLERLRRIRSNLQSTLDVCLRARAALERREAPSLSRSDGFAERVEPSEDQREALAGLSHMLRPRRARLPQGARCEMSSPRELRKFERLGRIDSGEIAGCDIEELSRRLQGS